MIKNLLLSIVTVFGGMAAFAVIFNKEENTKEEVRKDDKKSTFSVFDETAAEVILEAMK